MELIDLLERQMLFHTILSDRLTVNLMLINFLIPTWLVR